jgi:asparagine synthase (glutamine-hydrolysing)
LCAKLACENGAHTLYAGDGGDELFAGNERYATQRLFDRYHRIPEWFRKTVLQPVVFSIADRLGREPFVKGKKYIQRASIPYPDRLSSYGFLKVHSMAELLLDSALEVVGSYDPDEALRTHYSRAPASSELDRQLYIDLKLAISDNDLFKVTRMTEAAGIKVRFPLLDHRLAEFAARIPSRIKMPGRALRAFFKEAYADFLPREVLAKRKHGFGLPIPIWLRTDKELNEMMVELLLSPTAIQRGYFRRKALEQLIERHKTDQTSFYGTAIWNLMVLELWHRSR